MVQVTCLGGTGKSRSREAAGRRNWPEAVPENAGQKREADSTEREFGARTRAVEQAAILQKATELIRFAGPALAR